jgi:hypothetical protein
VVLGITKCRFLVYCLYEVNELTPWSRVLLQNLTVTQLVNEYLAFYGIRGFITVFTSTRQFRSLHKVSLTGCFLEKLLALAQLPQWRTTHYRLSTTAHLTHLATRFHCSILQVEIMRNQTRQTVTNQKSCAATVIFLGDSR